MAVSRVSRYLSPMSARSVWREVVRPALTPQMAELLAQLSSAAAMERADLALACFTSLRAQGDGWLPTALRQTIEHCVEDGCADGVEEAAWYVEEFLAAQPFDEPATYEQFVDLHNRMLDWFVGTQNGQKQAARERFVSLGRARSYRHIRVSSDRESDENSSVLSSLPNSPAHGRMVGELSALRLSYMESVQDLRLTVGTADGSLSPDTFEKTLLSAGADNAAGNDETLDLVSGLHEMHATFKSDGGSVWNGSPPGANRSFDWKHASADNLIRDQVEPDEATSMSSSLSLRQRRLTVLFNTSW